MKKRLLILMVMVLPLVAGALRGENPSKDFRTMTVGEAIGEQGTDKAYTFGDIKVFRISGGTLAIAANSGSNGFKAEGSGIVISPNIAIAGIKIIGSSTKSAGIALKSVESNSTAYNGTYSAVSYTPTGVTSFVKSEGTLNLELNAAKGDFIKVLWDSNIFIHYIELIPAIIGPSTDATLSSLTINGEDASASIESGINYSYAFPYDYNEATFTALATPTDTENATVAYSVGGVDKVGGVIETPANDSSTDVTITVTPESGADDAATYVLRVSKAASASSEKEITSLTIDGNDATLNEETGAYSYTVPYAYEGTCVLALTVSDFASYDENLTVNVPEQNVLGATATTTITVTAQDNTTKNHTLTIIREAARTTTSVASVTIGGTKLTPTFTEGVYTYEVPYGSTTYPAVTEATPGNDGSTFVSIGQIDNDNKVAINMLAEDGSTTGIHYVQFATAAPVAAKIGTFVKEWNFTNWSAETLANIAADTENWQTETAGVRYSNKGKMYGTIKANGIEIAEFSGLLLGTSDISAKGIRVDYSGDVKLAYNGSNLTITIPNRKANEVIIVRATANGSGDRGITATNATRVKGNEFLSSTSIDVNEFKVTANGDVVLKQNSGLKWYSILIIESESVELSAANLSNKSDIVIFGDLTPDDIALLNANSSALTSINLNSAYYVSGGLAPQNANCVIYSNSAYSATNVVINGSAGAVSFVDGHPFNLPTAFTATSATYTRSFPAAGIASFSLPFACEKPSAIGVKVFEKSVDTTIYFKDLVGTALAAGTPYIAMIANDNTTVEFTAEDEVSVIASSAAGSEAGSDYTFKASLSAISATDAEGKYILKSDGTGFGKAAGANIPAFRAYIDGADAGNGADGNARPLSIDLDNGGATFVETYQAGELRYWSAGGTLGIFAEEAQNISIYAIDGTFIGNYRLSEGENTINGLAPGVYAINKAKVIIK